MTPVERYRAELDTLCAPDALKQKLYDIPAQHSVTTTTDTTAQEAKTSPMQPAKTIRFALPKQWKKYALTAAACFAIGVFSTDAMGWQVLPKMGSENATYDTVSITSGTSGATGANTVMDVMITESAVANSMTTSTTAEAADIAVTRDADAATETTRKIIYTTRLTLETKTYDDTLAAISTVVSALGGYLEYSENYNENYSHNEGERMGYFTYRIPATNYASFMASLGENGNLTYLSESANDVTTEYLDLAARITTLTQQRDRLWELQAEAETLSDLLEIEATLTDVLYQIESYQSQLNYLADQVDYATITVSLDEVIDYTVTETNIWDTICTTFTGALANFVATIGGVLLFILSIWVWLALALVAFFVYHSIKRKRP